MPQKGWLNIGQGQATKIYQSKLIFYMNAPPGALLVQIYFK